eukprot:TRINITY_DN56443_c0_g1_i1.p1 TRINITY_DN56443_c0_g1~~TRINITY_DN56443_c0_g1_i1.p1  ORF type:complete len:457 (-),score=77.97 TRINITY_DN56443_c0_g1_i1:78-1448(-)
MIKSAGVVGTLVFSLPLVFHVGQCLNILDSRSQGLRNHMKHAEDPERRMTLRLMPEHGLASGRGAACLDGSDAGFYFAPAQDPGGARKWQIIMEGGAWCISGRDCFNRSETLLGSSKNWGKDRKTMSGIYSDDCAVNPSFCNFNRVIIPYCDGASFSGDREKPMDVKGKQIYFRGKRIMDAVIDTLLPMGLKRAEEVMFSGTSAGGVAALLHADRIRDRLQGKEAPALRKFRVVPTSSLFLDHKNVNSDAIYAEQMANVYRMHRSGSGVDETCADAFKADERWRCMIGIQAYEYVDSPIFVINSNIDQWALSFIQAGKIPTGWDEADRGESHLMCCTDDTYKCFRREQGELALTFSSCDNRLFANLVQQYQNDFVQELTRTPTFTKAGNGAFIHSCSAHEEAKEDDAFATITIKGKSMQQALSAWWFSDHGGAETYMDCSVGTAPPYNCNPSCNAR